MDENHMTAVATLPRAMFEAGFSPLAHRMQAQKAQSPMHTPCLV